MRPPVLLYHGFTSSYGTELPDHLFIDVGTFRQQLVALNRWGYRFLTADQFLHGGGRSGRDILLTIDDGFRSVHDLALPILAELEIPAVLFVAPALLAPPPRGYLRYAELLTPDELTDVFSHGVMIGAHGLDHTDLTTLPEQALREQLSRASEMISDITGCRPTILSYPGGQLDEKVAHAVQLCGYRAGFSVTRDLGTYGIPRITVNSSWSPWRLRLELLATIRYLRDVRSRFRSRSA